MVIPIMTYHNNGKTEHTHTYINKYIHLLYACVRMCMFEFVCLCGCVGHSLSLRWWHVDIYQAASHALCPSPGNILLF